MSDIAISVENLSKRYLIGHQSVQRQRYAALRDVIGREARNFVRKAADLVRGRQIVQGDEVEELWALKDVSFEVKEGEVVGIIGRNGAGKSTLLKILSRITEPTEGRVRLRGRVGSLLEVGTGFHPELTGRENIFLNGAILGMSRREIARKFDEIVAFADVEKFLDTPVKRYSSGMYVRLAFAVAAHLEPEILIVDEVLAVGDAEFQKKCLGKMRDVSRTGRTVLFVSHNIAAIRALCTKGIFLQAGLLRSHGIIESVAGTYLSGDADGSATLNFRPSVVQKPRFLKIASDKARYSFGEKMKLSIDLLSPERSKAAIELEIHDERGTPILYASTAPMHGTLLDLPANCPTQATIEIGPLLLATGDYSIYFWLINPWIEDYHIAEQPLRFAVDVSDPGGVGFDFKQAYGRGALTLPIQVLG